MNDVVERLPAPLRARWQHIISLGEQLAAAIPDGEAGRIAELAAERDECIRQCFEHFPADSDTAAIRQQMLVLLLETNVNLMRDARAALGDAAGSSVATRHTLRAMAAYRACE